MKRFLQRLSLLLAVLLLLTTAVFADFGPKPQLVVRVEQPPQEEYYLDLLDTGDWAKNLYDLDERELDPALLAALRAAVPSGWHACIAQGSTRAPIWGELTGEPDGSGAMLHSFRYYGVPETYRILMVTASGETFLSDVLTRRTLQSSVTVDWTAKTAKPPLQSVGYLLQFAATFVPTILIELVVLLLFGFKLKENWKPFLLVNLVTQGLLHGYFALFAVNNAGGVYLPRRTQGPVKAPRVPVRLVRQRLLGCAGLFSGRAGLAVRRIHQLRLLITSKTGEASFSVFPGRFFQAAFPQPCFFIQKTENLS